MSNGIVLLSGYNARGQAYAQALIEAGIRPDKVVLYGDPGRDVPRPEAERPSERFGNIFLPDLTVTLRATCTAQDWEVAALDAESVNDPSVAETLRGIVPGLIIYAGYGGQLVGTGVLDLGFPVLHCHPGWVPDFRGSTTIYFSLLAEGSCAVSAIILDAGIDTGPIVAQKRYPAPHGMDVDYLYDNAIRADTMINVVKTFLDTGALPATRHQPAEERTYYVIHPLLKHIAILGLDTEAAAPTETDE